MEKKDWLSERILFGALIIFGYFSMVAIAVILPAAVVAALPPDRASTEIPVITNAVSTVKDSLLVIGPLLGVIVQAIWKSDRTDKANAETISGLVSAVQTAQAQPAAEVKE